MKNESSSENRTVSVYSYTITWEPFISSDCPKEVSEIKDKLFNLINQGNINEALKLAQESVKKFPDQRSLYTYLIKAYAVSGDNDKAREIAYKAYEKFPDYLFAKGNYAIFAIQDGKLDQIPQIFEDSYSLKALYPARDEFHISEVRFFHFVMVKYFVAKNYLEAARGHLDILNRLLPDDEITQDMLVLFNAKKIDYNIRQYVKDTPFEELERALSTDLLVRAAIYKMMEDPEKAIPILLDIVEKRYADAKDDEGDIESSDFIIAFTALAAFREKRAFPILLKWLQLPEHRIDFLFCDLIENFASWLISTFNGNYDGLMNLILNEDVYVYSRSAGLDVLLSLYDQHVLSREDLIARLREIYNSSKLRDPLMAAFWVYAACSVYPEELQSEITELFENNRVELDFINEKFVKDCMALGKQKCLEKHIANNCWIKPVEGLLEDYYIQSFVDDDGCLYEDLDIGRNDACACGSGKKYKKCCLAIRDRFLQGTINCFF